MRSVDEIYQEMLAKLAERCGFQPEETCDLAVRLYAAAAQVQALDIQAEWVLDQSFPQTAQGEYLDRHGVMRGLNRTAAAKAVGTLRFSVSTASAALAANEAPRISAAVHSTKGSAMGLPNQYKFR